MSMYFSEEDIDTLKEAVSPLMVVQALGKETRKVGGNLSILCPSPDHNDQHFGSCMLMHDGRVCKCFACDKTFNSLQIVMMETGCSLYEAMCTLAEIAGLEDQFDASSKKSKTQLIKNLPNELKQLIGLAGYSKIRNVNNCSDFREGTANYMRDQDGTYVRYDSGNWKPWIDLRKEEPETFDWLVRNKCKEKMSAISMVKGKIRKPDGSQTSRLCYDIMQDYNYSSSDVLKELDELYQTIKKIYIDHGGRIKDEKTIALNVCKIMSYY